MAHRITRKFFNSRRISALSSGLFLMVILIIFISNRYMASCVEQEALTQQNRAELKKLGEDLADASDYLTDEARKFSVTGDISHFYNYWHEVFSAKNRDRVISELSSYHPPEEEKALLSAAKAYSDTLIETETISMNLMLSALSITAEDHAGNQELYQYLQYVGGYSVPEQYHTLSSAEKREKAQEILYDSFYNQSKTLIMSPIQKFQDTMNSRLNIEVEKAAKGRSFASMAQIFCSFAVLILIGILLFAFNMLYIHPLNNYAAALSGTKAEEYLNSEDFSRVRVMPEGAYELYRFGEIFNHLSLILHNELKKRTLAEEKMRMARDEADRANQAKSQFFAQMSHELRTPLNAITGYLFLLKQSKLDENQKKYCKNIEASSENLLGLINNVLDFSKIESGNMAFDFTDFCLPELLQDVYSMMEQAALKKGIAMKLDIRGEIPQYLYGDSLKLKQVLINLVGNGIKFTAKGEVVLSTECLEEKEDRVFMEFAVCDTGIGIKKEDQEKIFEPFVQSDAGVARKYGGTGLGLPISQMIVKSLSGGACKLELDSEIGKGSCFYFKMKFTPGKEPERIMEQKERPRPLEENAAVLLVDDNDVNLNIEKEILKTYGIHVITADSGKAALKTAESVEVQLVLLDLHMPDMDGYETARKLRLMKAYRHTPIIALTADVVSGVENDIYKAGMDAYISKPFRPERLRDMIVNYLHIPAENTEFPEWQENAVFSSKEFLHTLQGDLSACVDLIRRFLYAHGRSAEYIAGHLKAHNYQNAGKILHDIKGLSGNLCCHRLYYAACDLYEECRENRQDSLSEFLAVWEMTIKELNAYLSSAEETGNKQGRTEPIDVCWQKFLSLCSDCDIAAADYFMEHRGNFKSHMEKQEFKLLEESVQKYEFTFLYEHFSSAKINDAK